MEGERRARAGPYLFLRQCFALEPRLVLNSSMLLPWALLGWEQACATTVGFLSISEVRHGFHSEQELLGVAGEDRPCAREPGQTAAVHRTSNRHLPVTALPSNSTSGTRP